MTTELDRLREDVVVLRDTIAEAVRLLECGKPAGDVLRGALERTKRSAVLVVGAQRRDQPSEAE